MNAPNKATIAPTITVRSRAWMNAEFAAAVIRFATSGGSSAAANDAAPTESFTASANSGEAVCMVAKPGSPAIVDE